MLENEQNKERNLRFLASADFLYSRAKFYFSLQFIFSTLIVFLLLLFNIIFSLSFDNHIAVYSLAITLFNILFLSDYINNTTVLAARFQEAFDTAVLEIEWNNLIKPIEFNFALRYSNKYIEKNGNISLKKDWYSTCLYDSKAAIIPIICQASNLNYDFTLRRYFRNFFYILLVLILAPLFIYGYFYHLAFDDMLILFLIPLLPIVSFSSEQIKKHHKSIKTLTDLKYDFKFYWNTILNSGEVDLKNISRCIQDRIYMNRINNPLIFNWFYKLFRNQLEAEMDFSFEHLLEEYNSKKKD